jgi:hypothetical protein
MNPALRVGPTVRGDRGVFANQTIVRGSRLFICGGSVLSLSDEDSLPSECADKPIEISEWFSLGPRTDTDIPLVPQHYVNHSCNPNAGWEGQLTLVALRNILAGEEVCYDYCMVMQSNASSGSYWSMNCECRQSTCRHIIAEDDWTRPELQARYNGFFAWHLQQKIDAVNKGLTLPTFRAHDGKRNGWNWIDNRLISHGSRISNTGLFASAYIPGGTIVFVNGGRVFGINREPLDLSLQILDDFVIGPDVGEESVSDHINHSCAGNLGFFGALHLVTLRDVHAGEELCFDYALCLGGQTPYQMPCNCNQPGCRHVITERDWQRPELQIRYEGYFQPYLSQKIRDARRL